MSQLYVVLYGPVYRDPRTYIVETNSAGQHNTCSPPGACLPVAASVRFTVSVPDDTPES